MTTKKLVKAAAARVWQFKAWSMSRLRDWEKCPFFALHKHLIKSVPEQTNPAMERGSQVHKGAELFLLGKMKKLPKDLSLVAKHVEAAKKARANPEGKWAVTKEWVSTFFKDWTNAWLRVVTDAHWPENKGKRVIVVDWKTGQYKPERVEEYNDQMKIYAPTTMVHYPEAKEVVTRIVFTDHNKVEEKVYQVGERKSLIAYWNNRVKGMMNDTRFVKRPGYYCGRCQFSKNNGGPCKF